MHVLATDNRFIVNPPQRSRHAALRWRRTAR